MRGKGRRWSGHDSGKWGRCLSSAAAGRPCDRLGTLGRGEMARRGRGKRRPQTGLARVCGDVRLAGWRVSCRQVVRLGVESLAAVPGRD